MADDPSSETSLPIEAIRECLEREPVRVAILFGSHARGDTHPDSDIDIAIELEDLRPGETGYNDVFFGVSAELSERLETDDVDVVDIHSVSDSFARTILKEGIVLLGTPDRLETLRERVTSDSGDDRTPRERIDDAVRRIDEHLA